MTEPQRVYVTGGSMLVHTPGTFWIMLAVLLIPGSFWGVGFMLAAALDRNTAAMEAPACVPIEVEPLQPPAVLENQ